MSDVGGIKAGLESARNAINTAPYIDAAKAFNGIEIIDGDRFHAKLNTLATNLGDNDTMPSLVAGAAMTAWAELAATQESDESMQPVVGKAFDHLGVMREKAETARGRTEVMRGLAEKALGLYQEFTKTMEDFEANRAQGEKELNESAQGAQLAKQSISEYEATL